MRTLPPGVPELGRRLQSLGWVTELLIGGSAATGDYVPGVSDLDLVALVSGPLNASRRMTLSAMHADLDEGDAAGQQLGCAYVQDALLHQSGALHPTWTHGRLAQRTLSGISRVELARHGYAVFGRAPQDLLPAVSDDDVRRARRAHRILGHGSQPALVVA